MLNRYQPEDENAWSRGELRQTWWAMGQGMASGFQRVISEESDADGRRRMRVHGTSNHGSLEGEWDLTIDPSAGNLIRSGSFQLDVLETVPGLRVETSGLRRFGTLTLPDEGFVRKSSGVSGEPLTRRVVLLTFSSRADEEVFEKVRKLLDNAESSGDLTTYDYRENRTRPTITHETP